MCRLELEECDVENKTERYQFYAQFSRNADPYPLGVN